MPEFLQSEEEEDDDAMDGGLGVGRMKRRTRRQYDEQRDIDDLDGVEDVRRIACLIYSVLNNVCRRFPSSS
jgi:hypothetical protein